MNPEMQTTLNTLELSSALYLNGVATMNDDAARRAVVDNANTVIWLAGHLLLFRNYLLDLFGQARELPWASKFTEKYDPSADYPSMAELKETWVAVSEELGSQIKKASAGDLDRAIDWNIPNGDKTVRGAILFYTYHEAWHLGQIAYARKGMGMEGLVPY